MDTQAIAVTGACAAVGNGACGQSPAPTPIGVYGGKQYYRSSFSVSISGLASYAWATSGSDIASPTITGAYTGANSGRQYTGANSTWSIWGVQFETNVFVSSYIPTTTGSANRAADKITANCPASSFPNGITGVVRGVTGQGVAAVNQTVWTICDDGTTSNYIQIYRNSSRQMVGIVVSGGVTQATLTMGTVADSTPFTVSLAVGTTTASASLNSGAPVTGTISSFPTGFTKTRFGEDESSATQCFCTISRATLYNSYLPMKTSSNDNHSLERNLA
jgi:hypothetical protein